MIQLAAYKGRSLISRLVRWQTRSEFSHIALHFTQDMVINAGQKSVTILRGNVIEAWQRGGVALNESLGAHHTAHTELELYDFVKPLELSEAITMATFLVNQIGKRYDFLSVLRFMTREPESPFSREKWFSSELAFAACVVADRRLLKNTQPWHVPPDWIPRSPLLKFDKRIYT